MGDKTTFLITFLVLCHVVVGLWEEERSSVGPQRQNKMFMLQNSKRVAKTDAGEMRVLESHGGRISERRLHIGFINMEPNSLFVPQYLDSALIVFVRSGKAKLGFICKDELEELELKKGDIYQIPAGSAFYLENIADAQKLQVICSIDPSESLGLGIFQSFYIGGGAPVSVLSGFEPEILQTAFNTSTAELAKFFTRQQEGPIVHVGHSHATASSIWTKFLQLKKEDKLNHMKKMVQDQQEEEQEEGDSDEEEEQQTSWSLRKMLFGDDEKNNKLDKVTHKSAHHSCNLYDRKPDFKNNYGWSVAVDGSDYHPLKSSGVGIYHVNLKAGSMMTPHVNPRATEYGIVLRGSGRIQIVFPNGTNAMDTQIKEGDVFFIPRYFAFCQIASRNGPLDFFGFTTSSKKNNPQFLVGATSLMKTMMGPELATAFGVSEEMLHHVLNAQHEAVILPTPWAETRQHKKKLDLESLPKVITNDMIMGF